MEVEKVKNRSGKVFFNSKSQITKLSYCRYPEDHIYLWRPQSVSLFQQALLQKNFELFGLLIVYYRTAKCEQRRHCGEVVFFAHRFTLYPNHFKLTVVAQLFSHAAHRPLFTIHRVLEYPMHCEEWPIQSGQSRVANPRSAADTMTHPAWRRFPIILIVFFRTQYQHFPFSIHAFSSNGSISTMMQNNGARTNPLALVHHACAQIIHTLLHTALLNTNFLPNAFSLLLRTGTTSVDIEHYSIFLKAVHRWWLHTAWPSLQRIQVTIFCTILLWHKRHRTVSHAKNVASLLACYPPFPTWFWSSGSELYQHQLTFALGNRFERSHSSQDRTITSVASPLYNTCNHLLDTNPFLICLAP